MEKTYDPQAIEKNWYQFWESHGYFTPAKQGTPYCIMIPPPNVTGYLHMGHGFQHSLMDALIRYQRMQGCDTLWQMGTDHAGIATQMVVERQLNQQGKTSRELGRGAFVEKIWEWKTHSGGAITQQIRRLGDSVDWSRERFTMDEGLSQAVIEAFVRLHDEGLIYRGKRLVNWDPVLLTAVSDLEVVTSEQPGKLWHIRYPLADNSEDYLVVATTRPETMLGDTAVAVHPQDERYQQLIGKKIQLPLTDRVIPIIADDYVDREFGSGCVKITPAHDFNDYEIGKRHSLPMINIFTPEAKLNEEVSAAYRGLDRFAAREKIIADLENTGLLEKTADHMLSIPRGEKSDAIIEPYLTDQWYVKTAPLAQPAMAAVESGAIKFIPENWGKTYLQWLTNIQDWCISRQLWWGHRIPAWYDNQGNIYVGMDETAVRQKYKLNADIKLRQDEDVLDTWFSASLWPFATLGWPEKTPELLRYYPTNVLVTGFDIIFFWVCRMVMMGLKFTGQIPFKEVYITGLIRDAEGQKMSKSKGNVLDPIDLIDGIELPALIQKRTFGLMQPQMAEKIIKHTKQQFPDGIPAYGTDALRFTFCALATPGREIRFDLGRLSGYRNFCNKLWNATRFVLQNTEEQKFALETAQFSSADRWITTRLQHTIQLVHEHFKNYRFDLLTQCLYDFTWNEFCDWYLEFSKVALYDKTVDAQLLAGTRYTLVQTLESLLRLLHPLMPFITEEIWQKVGPLAGCRGETIMLQPFPQFDLKQTDEKAAREMEWLKAVITAIRNIRSEMGITPAKLINVLLHKGTAIDRQFFTQSKNRLLTLAKIATLEWQVENQPTPAAATALVGDLEILIPLADLIDKNAELIRLQKEIDKTSKDLQRAQTKLATDSFVKNAPEAIVTQERARLSEMQAALTKYQEQLEKIREL